MVTINQLVKKKVIRKKKKIRKFHLLGLNGAPQKKGVCVKFRFVNPKKPNSAIRKVVRLRLSNDKIITAYIPGQGHNLQKYSTVLVRGGRVKDIPGLRYKLIKGKYDFSYEEKIKRVNSRSKYGCPKR